MDKPKTTNYQNNPFSIALDGLNAFFKNAKSIAIAMLVLSVLGFVGQGIQSMADVANQLTHSEASLKAADNNAQEKWNAMFNSLNTSDIIAFAVVVGTLLFIFIIFALVFAGVSDYAAAKVAHNQKTTLKEALKAVFPQLGSYLWMQIIVVTKILLWSLLFIIPGIIMAVRYSLAGVSFFADGKRGNEAVKHSLVLTKGGWLTTFASGALWNFITFGSIQSLLAPGTNGVLYRQFSELEHAKQPKPPAHMLSWLTLLIPICLTVLGILFVLTIAVALSINGFS